MASRLLIATRLLRPASTDAARCFAAAAPAASSKQTTAPELRSLIQQFQQQQQQHQQHEQQRDLNKSMQVLQVCGCEPFVVLQ